MFHTCSSCSSRNTLRSEDVSNMPRAKSFELTCCLTRTLPDDVPHTPLTPSCTVRGSAPATCVRPWLDSNSRMRSLRTCAKTDAVAQFRHITSRPILYTSCRNVANSNCACMHHRKCLLLGIAHLQHLLHFGHGLVQLLDLHEQRPTLCY